MAKLIKSLIVLLSIVSSSPIIAIFASPLIVGYYNDQCPDAESIISGVVASATSSNSRVPAQLLRLHFHDCFVTGCDGSILIDNGPNSERNAEAHRGLGGFDVIDAAKAQLEAACPGVVSCSDILALATRDGIVLSNGPSYDVPTGRRDGTVSDVSSVTDFPDVDDPIDTLRYKFASRGFDDKGLVLLSASHTIGTAACFFMTNRLYNFSPDSPSDPTINPAFINELQSICPQGGDVEVRQAIDHGSEFTFDRSIFQNMRDGFAVLASDARIYEDGSTGSMVNYFLDGTTFEDEYKAAIVNLGQVGVLAGYDGEIRQVCSSFN